MKEKKMRGKRQETKGEYAKKEMNRVTRKANAWREIQTSKHGHRVMK